MIGNGYCNDETNNIDCNFDGGDCCGNCANADHCSDCVCHAESPIASCGKYYQILSISVVNFKLLIPSKIKPNYHNV